MIQQKFKPVDTVKQPIVKQYLVIKHIEPEKTFSEKAIEYGGFGISALSFIITLILAWVALRSLGLNKRQADAAIDAVKAQTVAIEAENRRFEIENQPYLDLQDFVELIDRSGTLVHTVNFNLFNLGRYPVKINQYRFHLHIRLEDSVMSMPDFWDELHTRELNKSGRYLPPLQKMFFSIRENGETDASKFSPPSDGLAMAYYSGEIQYENLINSEMKVYRFLLVLTFSNKSNILLLHNENIDNYLPLHNS